MAGLLLGGCRAWSGDAVSNAQGGSTGWPSLAKVPERGEEARCLEEIARARALPAAVGAPGFESRRAEILARAKGAPVLLVGEPRAAEPSAQAALHKGELARARAQASTLFRLYPKLTRNPRLAREVLLRDGYLYAETPSLAFGLSHVVKLEHLFREARLWLQRGSRTLELRRSQRGYVEVDTGRRATLLFLDRVATQPEELGSPLHRDLEAVRAELGFDSLTVRHLAEPEIVVDAHYGELSVPTLLAARGAELLLVCEAISGDARRAVSSRRQARRARAELVTKVKDAIDLSIDEALPFDEPRTEFGQEDGKLRDAWLEAYRARRTRYFHNEDAYWVFGSGGHPAVPQVCIDFIADSFERASGSWFAPRGEPPQRTPGGVDFDRLALPSRRRVADFVAFAEGHPEWFDVWRPARLVPLTRRQRFFAFIAENRKEFLPGDVVVIYGLRDDEQPHYHSFFVYESDPVTQMPIQLASNAVLPQIRSWEGEMHNAPRRSIRVRIRPRSTWLAQILGGDTDGASARLSPGLENDE